MADKQMNTKRLQRKIDALKTRNKKAEKTIEEELRLKVEVLGGKALKWISPSNNGVADRIILLPGAAPWFVEMKKAKGRASKAQKYFAAWLQGNGFQYALLDSSEKVNTFIANYLHSVIGSK